MIYIDLSAYQFLPPCFYLGIEEYYLKNINEDVLLLWRPSPSVVIGRHQILQKEVNLEYALANNISLNRRFSGGGAIYADQNNLMYTFIGKALDKDLFFKKQLGYISKVFEKHGIIIESSGRNDLLFRGKKFSGTAFTLHGSRALIHGTMLFDVDIEKMVKVLSPNVAKLIEKGIESVRQRVINMSDWLSLEQFSHDLIELCQCEIIHFGPKELELAQEYIDKLSSPSWINKDIASYNIKIAAHFPSGNYQVDILIEHNKIEDIIFSGDFFFYQDLTSLYDFFIGIEYNEKKILDIINSLDVEDYIKDLSRSQLAYLLFGKEMNI